MFCVVAASSFIHMLPFDPSRTLSADVTDASDVSDDEWDVVMSPDDLSGRETTVTVHRNETENNKTNAIFDFTSKESHPVRPVSEAEESDYEAPAAVFHQDNIKFRPLPSKRFAPASVLVNSDNNVDDLASPCEETEPLNQPIENQDTSLTTSATQTSLRTLPSFFSNLFARSNTNQDLNNQEDIEMKVNDKKSVNDAHTTPASSFENVSFDGVHLNRSTKSSTSNIVSSQIDKPECSVM